MHTRFAGARCALYNAVAVIAPAGSVASAAVRQQLAANDAIAAAPQRLTADDGPGQVVVTSARAPGRTIASDTAPIDVVDRIDLANTGEIDAMEALNDGLPLFNFSTQIEQLWGACQGAVSGAMADLKISMGRSR